jgi:NADPH-dependent F420 reductase
MSNSLPSLAVIGGTGNLGSALARRWSLAGYQVTIGSRDASRSGAHAAQLSAELGVAVRGDGNPEAAAAADIVVVTVPFSHQREVLASIRPFVAGKVVVDATVPLVPPKVMRVQLPGEGSAALIAQAVLGEGVHVVSAFHNVAAHRLITDEEIDCDVLVFGDSKKARSTVVKLALDARLRGIHAGALANSAAAEALTSVLIFINKTYAVDGAGLRITGQLIEPAAD